MTVLKTTLTMSVLAALSACEKAQETTEAPPVMAVEVEQTCGDDAYLSAELYGIIERSLRWSATDMRCQSMLRPNGEGVRLRFTGHAADRQLAVILALPDLERAGTGKELATVATLTVEGSGRFFSTPNLDSCWSDISAQDAIEGSEDRYDVTGTLYCVAPLGEINGDAAVSIPRLEFRGTIEWGAE